jgi:hypothetical protein
MLLDGELRLAELTLSDGERQSKRRGYQVKPPWAL